MAITRSKKETIITQVKDLLTESKLTLIIDYKGVSVKQFQSLRFQMNKEGIVVKVIKNRLVRQALNDLKFVEDDHQLDLNGMLVYVFNPVDEVRGAQIIKSFVKSSNASLNFMGAITGNGQLMSKQEVVKLAGLSSKNELIGSIIRSLQSPLNQLQTTVSSGLPNLLISVKTSKV